MRKSFFSIILLVCISSLAFSQSGKYEIKSGILKKEATMMGQKMIIDWYFDEYGNIESVFSTVKAPKILGGDKNVQAITRDGMLTTIDLDEKKGISLPVEEEHIDFLRLSDENIAKYNLEEVGEETVAGKLCKIYTLQREEMGMKVDARIWIWKGLQMRSELSSGGMNIYKDIVTGVQENVPVPVEKLSVPSGIRGV